MHGCTYVCTLYVLYVWCVSMYICMYVYVCVCKHACMYFRSLLTTHGPSFHFQGWSCSPWTILMPHLQTQTPLVYMLTHLAAFYYPTWMKVSHILTLHAVGGHTHSMYTWLEHVCVHLLACSIKVDGYPVDVNRAVCDSVSLSLQAIVALSPFSIECSFFLLCLSLPHRWHCLHTCDHRSAGPTGWGTTQNAEGSVQFWYVRRCWSVLITVCALAFV